MTVGVSATTQEIIDKLENTYGNIKTAGENLLAEFYMDEPKADWGLRRKLKKCSENGFGIHGVPTFEKCYKAFL